RVRFRGVPGPRATVAGWRCRPGRISAPGPTPRGRSRRSRTGAAQFGRRLRTLAFREPGHSGQAMRGAFEPGLADERIAVERLGEHGDALAGREHALIDFLEPAAAVEQERHVVARFEAHLAGQHRYA